MRFAFKVSTIVASLALTSLLASPTTSAAASAAHFRSIRIDTSGLANLIGPAYAARVQQMMAPAAARAFGDRITPGSGPLLVIRIDGLKLATEPKMSDMATDFLRGAAIIVDRGQAVAEYPLRAAHASETAVWQAPDYSENLRLSDACAFYAQSLRRQMGL